MVLLHLIFNCRGEPGQAGRSYRIQQLSLAGKVPVSRIRRDTRLPGRLSQNDCIGSSKPRHLKPSCYERVAQIAMTKGLAFLNGDGLFHCLFKKSVTRRRMIVDSIHFAVVTFVDGVYFIAIHC